jgi:hypothetical protein
LFKKALFGMGKRLFYSCFTPSTLCKPSLIPLFNRRFSCIFPPLALFSRNDTMIRKYWWLVVFAISVFIFDALLMQWIELMSTETDKCRNMNSVNP